jgi:hypothetical protein
MLRITHVEMLPLETKQSGDELLPHSDLRGECFYRKYHAALSDYILWGYLKDKVFSSAPRTLPELKKRIKESCAHVTRGMLIRVLRNFVLRHQAVRESQGVHIEHVIHNATHM